MYTELVQSDLAVVVADDLVFDLNCLYALDVVEIDPRSKRIETGRQAWRGRSLVDQTHSSMHPRRLAPFQSSL